MTNAPSGAALPLDRAALFAQLRDKSSKAFGGPLKQSQVDGTEAIIEEGLRRGTPRNRLANKLATAYHETAFTMQPIHERGAKAYFNKYEPGTKIGKVLGNTQKGDGYRFRGRGLPQLTGRRNYALASKKLGIDLVANPDLALKPEYAIPIMFDGMTEGWFTGKKLSDYIDDIDEDDAEDLREFIAARRVVNGTDKAKAIGEYALAFEKALAAANYPVVAPVPEVVVQATGTFPEYGAKDDEFVAQVQRRLKELGYHEIGNIDGDFFDFTEDALMAFQKDNGLPSHGRIDAATWTQMARASPRPIPAARENATPAVVREKVPEAKDSWWSKVLAFWGMVGAFVTAAVQFVISSFSDAKELVKPIADTFGIVPWYGWLGLLGGGLLVIYLKSRGSEAKIGAAYQEGARR